MLIGAAVLGLQLSGCAVGPDFKAPANPDVDRYTTEPIPAQTSATTSTVHGGEAQALLIGEQLPQQWWKLFGSESLNALIDEAFAASPSVASARAALTQAQEIMRAQKGGLLPSVDAGVGAQRQKSFMNFGTPGVIGPMNLYNADVNVSYGIDLFGGLRRRIEAQESLVDYQRYELQSTYLTLAANVVTAAVQNASLRAQLDATNAMVTAQQQQLDVSEQQYRLGAIGYAELLTARSELASLRSSLPQLQQSLAVAQSQLAVYLGKLPMQQPAINFSFDDVTLPQQVPLGVPSELVRRRPDVLAAEAMLHQASAQVGVAKSDLFPKLTLSASYGGASDEWSSLFDNKVWSVGANLAQPIFRGGSLFARKRAAEAAYEGALADYRQTVLNAFKNTADTLQAVIADAESLQSQQIALQSADESLQLIEKQYRLGGASYLGLLTAQRQAQQARIIYLQRLASRYQNTAALLLAIGGGWTDDAAMTNAHAAAENPVAADDNHGIQNRTQE